MKISIWFLCFLYVALFVEAIDTRFVNVFYVCIQR